MFYWQNKIARKIRLGLINCEGEGDQGGGGGGNYYDGFPTEVQGWDEVKNSDTPDKFWQQITSHRQHLGQSIRIPSSDASDADRIAFHTKLQEKVPGLMEAPNVEDKDSMAAFHKRMGQPETPEDYKIPEFKDAEGKVLTDLDHTLTKEFMPIAHAIGLTQDQFKGIVSGITNINLATADASAASLKEAQEAIATEWGAALDQNYTILGNFAKKTDAPPNVVAAIEGKTLDQPTAAWMLKAANASMGKDGRGVDDDSGATGVMSPGEATERLAEIMNNREHPYWKKMDPGHKAAIARVRELHILKDPQNAKAQAPGTTFNVGG